MILTTRVPRFDPCSSGRPQVFSDQRHCWIVPHWRSRTSNLTSSAAAPAHPAFRPGRGRRPGRSEPPRIHRVPDVPGRREPTFSPSPRGRPGSHARLYRRPNAVGGGWPSPAICGKHSSAPLRPVLLVRLVAQQPGGMPPGRVWPRHGDSAATGRTRHPRRAPHRPSGCEVRPAVMQRPCARG